MVRPLLSPQCQRTTEVVEPASCNCSKEPAMTNALKKLSPLILGLLILGLTPTVEAGGDIGPQYGMPQSEAMAPASTGPSTWVLVGAIVGVGVALLGGLKAWLELKKARLELAKVKAAEESQTV
jgi:hypothetical protein